jgi:hypothetical protein
LWLTDQLYHNPRFLYGYGKYNVLYVISTKRERLSSGTAIVAGAGGHPFPLRPWGRRGKESALNPLDLLPDQGVEVPRHAQGDAPGPGETRLAVALLAQLVDENAVEHAGDRRPVQHRFESRMGLVVALGHAPNQRMVAARVT